jgi:uncharacterized protein with NRDE domain
MIAEKYISLSLNLGVVQSQYLALNLNVRPDYQIRFSKAAGEYDEPIVVEILSDPAADAIYYTLDGSTPEAGSPEYNGAITVRWSKIIKAKAVFGAVSHEIEGEFIINSIDGFVVAKDSKQVVSIQEDFLWKSY